MTKRTPGTPAYTVQGQAGPGACKRQDPQAGLGAKQVDMFRKGGWVLRWGGGGYILGTAGAGYGKLQWRIYFWKWVESDYE